MALARQGDGDAFMALMRRVEGPVYALAFSHLLNEADAQDVVQETFLQAYECLNQLRSPDRFAAWISRIALSRVHRRYRLRKRETVMDVHAEMRETPAGGAEHEEFERREDAWSLLSDALRSLPSSLREPFLLRHISDAPYRLIGELLLIGPGAAEKRVRRAREALRRYLSSRGLDDKARDVLLSSAIVTSYPHVAASVAEALPSKPPGALEQNYGGGALAAGLAGALVITGSFVLLGGIKAMRAAAPLGARDAAMAAGPVAMWPVGGARLLGVGAARIGRSPIPVGARVIADMDFEGLAPGQPLPGWTSGVFAQADDDVPGAGRRVAAVNTNIPSAYYRFPMVQGIVTIEVEVASIGV